MRIKTLLSKISIAPSVFQQKAGHLRNENIGHARLKRFSLLFAGGFWVFNSFAQPSFGFAKQMGGTSNDQGFSIVLDASRNIYTTGGFGQNGFPADFDPGAGTYVLTPAGDFDIFVSKLDPSGNFLWAKQMGGTGADAGFSIVLDAGGNIYITGYFEGTADFDPGAGVYNLTKSGVGKDIFVCKLDASGNFVWARSMSGTGTNNWGKSITVDASGNVYTTGFFNGITDFDPGAGVYNFVSAGGYDIFVSKLDASGNFIWAKQMGGTGSDMGNSIALDAIGNVYTTGYFENTVDFDPGGPIVNFASAGGFDIFVSKLNASGNFVWAKQMGGTGNDQGLDITINASNGNIYTTGYFAGTVDFDPGGLVYNMTASASGTYDTFVSKLDALGNFVWAKQMGGAGTCYVNNICLDANENVYTVGSFYSTVDFDPGAGVYNLTGQAGNPDIFISKLDVSGSFLCAGKMAGPGFDWGSSITVDASGNIYTTGSFFDPTADFDPGSNVYNLTSAGNYDIFVAQYSCGSSILTTTASQTNIVCNGQCTGTATSNPVGGTNPYSYLWNTGGQTTIMATGLCAGTYTVIVTDGTGSTATAVVTITQPTTIILNVNSTNNTNCIIPNGTAIVTPGGGTPGYVYNWSNGQTTQTATGLAAGNYTATVTDANGCTQTQTVSINGPASPSATASSTNVSCSGGSDGSATVIATGGILPYSYSWLPVGGTNSVATGLSAGAYTVIVTDVNGCTTAITVTVVANPNPVVNAGISVTIAFGTSTTLNATGGGTYLWTPANGLNNPAISNPTATPTATTQYCVTVTDGNGCTAVACVTVTIEPLVCPPGEALYLPNAFSPNNDGENDVFCLQGVMDDCIRKIHISIYDRWGARVYESDNPKFCWDGTCKSHIMNSAMFVYYLKAIMTNSTEVINQGNISLVR